MTECKDTYVQTCNPAHPPAPLPECEHGWEIGNGTAVCATQQPTSVPLAATGGEPVTGLAALGVALVLGAGALLARRRARRA